MATTAKQQDRYSIRPAGTGRGSLESFNLDGVEIARRKTRRREFPLRYVFFFLVAVMAFKVFLYFDMGGSAYGAKMEELFEGTAIEQMASYAMVLDPVSKWLVDGVQFGRW